MSVVNKKNSASGIKAGKAADRKSYYPSAYVKSFSNSRSLFYLLILLSVIFAGFFYYLLSLNSELVKAEEEKKNSANTLYELQQKDESLEQKLKNIDSDETIERLAHELGMIRRGELVFKFDGWY